ncbi:unnamed protein product [Prorocentrum cordatum]|uniref:Tyr recombinase domain-containing protein n=1 Tax=Prorocentrum cordatum TaxID=2364126 RepID=A0ABN9S164_9DINO|nr:unnamed protein product [Polarella glacialis]
MVEPGAAANALWQFRGAAATPALQLPWEAAGPEPLAAPRTLLPVWEGHAEAEERELRLKQLLLVARTAGDHCRFNREAADAADDLRVHELLVNTFAGKATSTLARRACSMSLYMRWTRDNFGSAAHGFPLSESKAYEYVEDLRATGFLEAALLVHGTLGVEVEGGLPQSARIRGAVARSWERKRLTVNARPLKVKHLRLLESLTKEAPPRTSLEAGFLCYLVHSRSRARDLAKVEDEPYVDLSVSQGFIEVRAARAKTTRGLKRARLGLPVVGIAEGLTDDTFETWAEAWLRAREELGLRAGEGQYLMPAVSVGGVLVHDVPASAPQITAMLRRSLILAGAEPAEVEHYTSHSCKATLLSWMAKAGVPLSVRRMLGGHIKPGDKSVIEYSRDAMAGPLRELKGVLVKIAAEEFDPDATRSGRWRDGGPPATLASSGEATSAPSAEWNERQGAPKERANDDPADVADTGSEVEVGDGESTGESDEAEKHEALAAAETVGNDLEGALGLGMVVPTGYDVYFHPKSHVRHLLPLSEPVPGGRFACGRAASEMSQQGGASVQPLCKQCIGAAERPARARETRAA